MSEFDTLINKIDFNALSLGGGIAVLAIALVIGWVITTFIKAFFGKN